MSSDRSNISLLSSTLNSLQSLGLSRHLSYVHYKVQSIVPKLDIIMVELSEFDILSFSETWLNLAVTNDNISLLSYHLPERKVSSMHVWKKSLNERFSNMFLITSETIVYSFHYCLVLFQVTQLSTSWPIYTMHFLKLLILEKRYA